MNSSKVNTTGNIRTAKLSGKEHMSVHHSNSNLSKGLLNIKINCATTAKLTSKPTHSTTKQTTETQKHGEHFTVTTTHRSITQYLVNRPNKIPSPSTNYQNTGNLPAPILHLKATQRTDIVEGPSQPQRVTLIHTSEDREKSHSPSATAQPSQIVITPLITSYLPPRLAMPISKSNTVSSRGLITM